jgi:5-methylcytosine-specific restriction endonuclease McrA
MTSQKRAQFDPITGKRLRARAGRPWKALRAYVVEREMAVFGKVCCYECGRNVTGLSPVSDYNVDHILPKSLDFDTLEYECGNVDILCFRCNNGKDANRLDADREIEVLTEIASKNAQMGRTQTPVATLLGMFPRTAAR